jgi:DHA1 family tetracycline resistance protein-like MFS transporter
VAGLVSSLVLIFIAGHSVQSNWSYYTMFKFGWNETLVGYSLGFVGILVSIVQGGLIRLIIPKFGQNKALFFGLALNGLGLALFSFAFEGWMMYAILIPYALGGIAGPAIQGIISNQVPSNEQGEMQGALTSLMSLTSIVGPLLMNNLFAYFSKTTSIVYFPGMPFAVGSIMVFIAMILSYLSNKKHQSAS